VHHLESKLDGSAQTSKTGKRYENSKIFLTRDRRTPKTAVCHRIGVEVGVGGGLRAPVAGSDVAVRPDVRERVDDEVGGGG
jgi:hypothetical protein